MISHKKSQLTKVKIKGFKSIQNQEITLDRINVLIGGNGSGKSNFLSVFTLLDGILAGRLTLYSAQHGADALLSCSKIRSDHISMKFVFDNENSYGFDLIPTVNNYLIFRHEFYRNSTKNSVVAKAHTESALKQDILERNIWQVYHFSDISPDTKIKQPNDLADHAFLSSDAGNLAAFLYYLKSQFPSSYRQIVDHIQLIAPYFRDFFLKPQECNERQMCLRWTERNHDSVLNAAQLSDGTLRFICLATLLLQPV